MITQEETAFDALWADLRTHLEGQKRAATLEIRNYPQPIAGCDAQIPALWERRDRLVDDLNRMATLAPKGSVDNLKNFVSSCVALDEKDKQKYLDRLNALEPRSAAE